MSTKHTPGPWVADGAQEIVYGATDEGEHIVIVYELGVNEADHRLIAAAPELLDALQSLLASDRSSPNEIVGQDTDGHPLNAAGVARKVARAAIAKATGAQQ